MTKKSTPKVYDFIMFCLISLGDVFVHSVQSMEQVGKMFMVDFVQPDEGRCKHMGCVWKRALYIPKWH